MSGWEGRQESNNPSTVLRVRLAASTLAFMEAVSFGLCGAWCPGLWLLVTDPLCPQCLLLLGPRRSGHYPSVIGVWATADQRYPDDCGALVISHSLKLAINLAF